MPVAGGDRKRRATGVLPEVAVVCIEGVKQLEAACGVRYRREVSDLGLGSGKKEMQERLRVSGMLSVERLAGSGLNCTG